MPHRLGLSFHNHIWFAEIRSLECLSSHPAAHLSRPSVTVGEKSLLIETESKNNSPLARCQSEQGSKTCVCSYKQILLQTKISTFVGIISVMLSHTSFNNLSLLMTEISTFNEEHFDGHSCPKGLH